MARASSKKFSRLPEKGEEDTSNVDIYDAELTDKDYGIILDADGNLKSIFLPVGVTEIPFPIRKILDMFNVGVDLPTRVTLQ